MRNAIYYGKKTEMGGIRVVVRQPTEPVFNAHIHSTRQPATTLALDPREPPKTTGVARTSGIPGNPQKSQEIAVTAIRPEIGSPGNDGRMAGYFKKSGFLKKIRSNQHVGRGANFWRGSPDSAPFWAPKMGLLPARPRRRRNQALLPRFDPKSGRPEMMAGWPDFFRNPVRIS